MTNHKICINAEDDPNHQKRIAKYPGPRCYTCDVLVRRERKKANHETMAQRVYGLFKGVYDRLFRYQKGKCAWCQRATGRTKKLAIDHNHKCCDGPTSCGKCVRGLLCSKCNRHLGWLKDDPAAMLRGYQYLINPPAQRLLRELKLTSWKEFDGGMNGDGRRAEGTTYKIPAMASQGGGKPVQ